MAKLNKIITTTQAAEIGLIRKPSNKISGYTEESLETLLKEHFPGCDIGNEHTQHADGSLRKL